MRHFPQSPEKRREHSKKPAVTVATLKENGLTATQTYRDFQG
jgi:hypothetical protein